MGTTLLAMRYNEGVIVAADSQTSSNHIILNRAADKISMITNYIVCLRSGSSSDTQSIIDLVRNIVLKEQLQKQELIEVRVVAQIIRNICYERKSFLNCGLICAGWDNLHGGQVYIVIQGGTIFDSPIISSGSGSIFINSFCDINFKNCLNANKTKNLVIKAISLAIQKDGNSCRIIRLCKISNHGICSSYLNPTKIIKRILQCSLSNKIIVW